MRILQINTTVNSGSTGRIAEDIGQVLMAHGHESFIAYGRGDRPSASNLIKIGNKMDVYLHGLKTLVFDRHGFGSVASTEALIKKIEEVQPEAIGLHNLHGYYINIEILFNYLNKKDIPVIWTLFDCWSFTGHCSYFDSIQCEKWKTGCYECPKIKEYPSSFGLDNSTKNYEQKAILFNSLKKIELVVHSKWLEGFVKQSFLKHIPVHHIFSGIDLDVFKPTYGQFKNTHKSDGKKIILGCANIWDKRKGLDDFLILRELLSDDYVILLVGLSQKQIKAMPKGIIGIKRTESVEQLAEIYTLANVFVNPTYLDNFPTTNIEALACGTPVITYNTGGSPEAIDESTGKVVSKGDVASLKKAIIEVVEMGESQYLDSCRTRAERLFNKNDRYKDYLKIYEEIVNR